MLISESMVNSNNTVTMQLIIIYGRTFYLPSLSYVTHHEVNLAKLGPQFPPLGSGGINSTVVPPYPRFHFQQVQVPAVSHSLEADNPPDVSQKVSRSLRLHHSACVIHFPSAHHIGITSSHSITMVCTEP